MTCKICKHWQSFTTVRGYCAHPTTETRTTFINTKPQTVATVYYVTKAQDTCELLEAPATCVLRNEKVEAAK